MTARPQFTDEQRAFVVLNYEKYKASGYKIFVRISNDFAQKFPGARIPTKKAMQKMVAKFSKNQEVHSTVRPVLGKVTPDKPR